MFFRRKLRALALAVAFLPGQASCSRSPAEQPTVEAGLGGASQGGPASSGVTFEPGDASARRGEFELGPLPPDAPFEGWVDVRVANIGPQNTEYSTYYFLLKGKKARWDLYSEGGKGDPVGYRIYDGQAHKFFTVVRQPVLYTTDEAKLSAGAGAKAAWPFSPFALEPRATVKNVKCDRVVTRDGDLDYDACLASGIPVLPFQLLGTGMAKAVPFGALLEKKGLFPLSVLVRRARAPAGTSIRPTVASLNVFEVVRGLVPERAFELPSFPVMETADLVPPRLVR